MARDLASPPAERPLSTLEGTVERITYHNPSSGYTVLKLTTSRWGTATIVGQLSGVNPGEGLQIDGYWTSHPQHGRQFQSVRFRIALPATTEGIRKYLGSGLIRGVGPVTAGGRVSDRGAHALTRLVWQ